MKLILKEGHAEIMYGFVENAENYYMRLFMIKWLKQLLCGHNVLYPYYKKITNGYKTSSSRVICSKCGKLMLVELMISSEEFKFD